MQIPIHYSLSDFQSNYKIDFIEVSADNNISFLEYFEQLESKYQYELREFEDANIKLTELNKKLHQRMMDKLDAMYGNGKFAKQLKREAEAINWMGQFIERYKLPKHLNFSNRHKLGDEIWNCILEFEKIIKFIQFEIANIPAENDSSEIDFSDNADKVKLIMLEKLGVIGYIKTIQTHPDKILHTSQILSSFTGIPVKTLNTYLSPMLQSYRKDNDKNSPYKNPENLEKAERELIKLKIKKIDANR